MLQRAAAAGAASLAAPGTALANASGAAPGTASASSAEFARQHGLSDLWVGRVAGESSPLAAPRRFALVALEWSRAGAGAHPHVWVRTRTRAGGWSRWALATTGGHGPDRPNDGDRATPGDRATASANAFGEPLWAGAADLVQLRSTTPISGVRLHFISLASPSGHAAEPAAAYPRATPVLDTGGGQPPIIARSGWAHGHAPPAVPPGYGEVKFAFVHHTETLNGYGAAQVPSIIFGMYLYHRYTRGWNDLGYNFVVDAFGRIWEARKGGIDQAVIGAQAGGYNAESTGVAMLGSFVSAVPPPAAITALQRLLAWKLSLHGVPVLGRVRVEVNPSDAFYTPFPPGAEVLLPRIAGHRDGDSTSCPGDALYARLPAVRSRVAPLARGAAHVTLLAPARAAATPGAVPVKGRLTRIAGGPIARAPVELQQLTTTGSRTIATLTTGADGSFSAVLPLVRNAAVRSLHRRRPATTSPLLDLAVPPLITLSYTPSAPGSPGTPGTPAVLSGTVAPAKPHVVVEVDALGTTANTRLLRKTLTAHAGAFSLPLPALAPGRYLITARTAPDGDNAAGLGELTITVPSA